MIRAKVGDYVERDMCGVKMELKVTEVTDSRIICGPWEFDKLSGQEIDDELGWGPGTGRSGSFIKEITGADSKKD